MTDTPPMLPPISPAAARRFAAGLGLAVCVAATGCRGGGGFLAAKPASDPFAEASLAARTAGGDGDSGVVSLSDPGLGGGAVRTASAEFPAAPRASAPGVTRVDPFAAPAVARPAGDWLPGDGRGEAATVAVAEMKPADAFTAAAASPAAASEPIAPVDWAAEMAAFAGPADPAPDPFAAAAAVAEPAPAAPPVVAETPTAAAVAPFDQDELPPAPAWDAEPAAPAAAPQPRPAALGDAGATAPGSPRDDGWHSRRPTNIDPFTP